MYPSRFDQTILRLKKSVEALNENLRPNDPHAGEEVWDRQGYPETIKIGKD